MRASAVCVPLLVAACAVPDGGLFRAARFRDVHLYQRYAEALLHGHVPYRDFFMEYPPGALAVFMPPTLAGAAHYNAAFKALMAACTAATLVLVAAILVRLGATVRRVWAAASFVALSPVALGPISLNTYDAWPALLTVAALAALLARMDLLAFGLLGVAIAAKVYPVVLVPLALVWTARRRGLRSAVGAFSVCVAVAAAFLVPFLVLAPHGLVESFRSQAVRGLQIESLGAQVLVGVHHVAGVTVSVVHHTRTAVTYDVHGAAATALGVASSLLQLAAVCAVVWVYARARDDGRRLAVACAAAVAGFLAFSRVLSPQYLVWLVPLVPFVPGIATAAVLAVALALDQTWFFHYGSIVALGARSWFVLGRDLLLVVVFVLSLRHAVEDEDPVVLEDELPLGVPP